MTDVYDVGALSRHPWVGSPWRATADDTARVIAIWERMSPLQRRIMTILIENAPTPTDALALARKADLDGSPGRGATAVIASVLMCARRHFQAVEREFPFQFVDEEPGRRAFFLDRTTAAIWRNAISGLGRTSCAATHC